MRRAYAVGMAAVVGAAFVGALLLSVGYTRHVQQQADRRWCDLLGMLDQPAVPPSTERGRAVQGKIHQLRGQLGCGR